MTPKLFSRLVKADLHSTKYARFFLAHPESSWRCWRWVNFVGILLGIENNSVQDKPLTRKRSFQSCSRNL